MPVMYFCNLSLCEGSIRFCLLSTANTTWISICEYVLAILSVIQYAGPTGLAWLLFRGFYKDVGPNGPRPSLTSFGVFTLRPGLTFKSFIPSSIDSPAALDPAPFRLSQPRRQEARRHRSVRAGPAPMPGPNRYVRAQVFRHENEQ